MVKFQDVGRWSYEYDKNRLYKNYSKNFLYLKEKFIKMQPMIQSSTTISD